MSEAKYQALALRRFNEYRSAGIVNVQDPFKEIFVNPYAINYSCRFHNETLKTKGSKFYDHGLILDGEWDSIDKIGKSGIFDRSEAFASTYMRYVKGAPWVSTPIFEKKMCAMQEKGRVDGCTSRGELVERYNKLDYTFEVMQREGFLANQDGSGKLSYDNIVVTIGRTGMCMLAHGGAHRLAMARLLNIPEIPCLVMMRHSAWQETLSRFSLGDVRCLSKHPDMA